MNNIEDYEYLIKQREELLEARACLNNKLKRIDEVIEKVEYASSKISHNFIYVDLNCFINNLALFSGVCKDDIKIKFKFDGNLKFYIYSINDACKFDYYMDFPLGYDIVQTLDKCLKDSIWLSLSYDTECQSDIFEDEDLVLYLSFYDVVRFSNGNNPKDLFKKAAVESVIRNMGRQKKLT